MKFKFERGAYAADVYGLVEGEKVALGKNAAGETVLIPALAEMIHEAIAGKELEILDHGSMYQPGYLKWEQYQNPYRFRGEAIVAADGIIWQWPLRGHDGETYKDYLERLADKPRKLVSHFRCQKAITFEIPLGAVAYSLKRLLSTGLVVNLLDMKDIEEIDNLPSGIHAILFYDVYWVFTK